MKNLRREAGLLLAVILALVPLTVFSLAAAPMSALAADPGNPHALVYDMADLFTDEEEKELSETAAALKETMNMDVAVVTCEENGSSAREFADQFYEDQEMGVGSDHSGVLFLIDMDNRELWISTEGKMIRYLTDSRIEAILDDVYEHAADGDYFGAARAFLSDTETCYRNGISRGQFNQDEETGKISRYHHIAWYELLFALAVAGICAGGAVLSVLRSYGMKDDSSRMEANFRLSYRKDSSFALKKSLADVLLRTYVTQQAIASAKRGNGRGSGGGGFSSGGRSTTHRSSSGRSHGGGGRKF